MCEVFAAALEDEPDIEVLGTATSAEAALEQLAQQEHNMALISTNLPNGDALSLTEAITSVYPNVKVVILGMDNTETIIMRYIEAGAAGYVFSEDSVEELLQNLRAVHEGNALVSPEIAATLIERMSNLTDQLLDVGMDPEDYEELTRREKEILDLVEEGLTNQEIADKLTIELGTVKNHVHNILNKLNVNSRKDAAAFLAFVRAENTGVQPNE
jgi:DNA-binding NarL/FixJ family response regulator